MTLPADLTLRAISDVLAALAYAHDLTDFDGAPLRIVHRDVSPQNVFWTYDGEIKLMDFGVAKSAQGTTKTQAGFVKGKLAYMAPEQARGEALDRRADVFAVGIVMWELLTGDRLFKADSDAATMHGVLFDDIPALTIVALACEGAHADRCHHRIDARGCRSPPTPATPGASATGASRCGSAVRSSENVGANATCRRTTRSPDPPSSRRSRDRGS